MSFLDKLDSLPFGEPYPRADFGASGLVCFFNRIETKDLPIDRRAHSDGYGVSVLLSGSGRLESGGNTYELGPGTCFQFPYGTDSRMLYRAGQPFRECSLFLYGALFEQLTAGSIVPRQPRAVDLREPEPVIQNFLALHRYLDSQRPRSPLEVLRLVIALLASIESQRSSHSVTDPVVDRLLELFASETGDRQPLPEIAVEWGVPYHELRRRFRAATGTPLGQYRIAQRVERARSLLATHAVQDVADALGYPDAFSFSRQFRKYVGLSPSAYRRRTGLGGAGLGR